MPLDSGAIIVGASLYRIWCEDGPRHDAVPGSRLSALVSTGHLDLEDRVAPGGTEDWMEAWEVDHLFEHPVCAALRTHREALGRMRRSIRGGWLSVIEYREQRDRLLLTEPGVADSAWATRPRPDLKRAGAQSELQRAASEGAEAEARAEAERRRRERAATPGAAAAAEDDGEPSFLSFKRNVNRLLAGDLPEWADPTAVLFDWRDRWRSLVPRFVLLGLLLDPLQPVYHTQRWAVLALGGASIVSLLMQMASGERNRVWARRFGTCLAGCILVSIVLIVGMSMHADNGLIGRFVPKLAQWQDAKRGQ